MENSYKIGLDFGTTNSIVSYLNDSGILEAFQYGGPDGQKYIPSFIAYEDGYTEIGVGARTTATSSPNIESYGNFKMRLPLAESEFANYFESNRNPMGVTTDYLRELLVANEYSFREQQGKIAGLVVSVPEIWQRDIYNIGRERLQKLIQDLDIPLIQLVSEPVAAASYYAWEMQRRTQQQETEPFQGNLLVCDMGGGTFDVCLCNVRGDNKVEVLYFEGQGDKGLDSAGVAFDRRVVQQAYIKKHGFPLEENDPKFVRLLREFETVKISKHSKITNTLTNCLKTPNEFSEKVIYTFGDDGYIVTFSEIIEAFALICQGIQEVMQKIKIFIDTEKINIDKLFLVGGFSQFILVQKAIAEALGIEESDPRFDRKFNMEKSAYAISYGACLIANGLIDPTEKYVHTLGIILDTINAEAEREERLIPIIKGGVVLDDLATPQFADIRPIHSYHETPKITLWVDPQSKGNFFKELLPDTVKLPDFSEHDQWRIGIRVNRSQVAYLVIEEARGKKRVEYELGNVIIKMFPGGFVLFED